MNYMNLCARGKKINYIENVRNTWCSACTFWQSGACFSRVCVFDSFKYVLAIQLRNIFNVPNVIEFFKFWWTSPTHFYAFSFLLGILWNVQSQKVVSCEPVFLVGPNCLCTYCMVCSWYLFNIKNDNISWIFQSNAFQNFCEI